MTLKTIRDQYHLELGSMYPKSEINSIFKLIIEFYLNYDAAEIVLQANNKLKEIASDKILQALNRLKTKEPIQYVIGQTLFFNLTFRVDSNVLIPRPETEELVQWILSNVQTNKANHRLQILDIGTGSGCIAISLAKNISNADVFAIDISKPALKIAKENAINNKVTINFLNVDILNTTSLPQKFDIIVSNPPYVKLQEKKIMHENVLLHEPNVALYVSNKEPLIFYKKITDLASKYLTKKGKLYFEINQYLGAETIQLIKSKGFNTIILKKDFLRNDRMISATLT